MEIVCWAFQIYFIVLLVRVIFSWVQAFGGRIPDGVEPVHRIVYQLTEPLLAPFRRVIPPVGMFDISFIIAIIALQIVARIICSEV